MKKTAQLVFFVFGLCTNLLSQSDFTINPKDNTVITDSILEFSWNNLGIDYNYNLKIAEDPSFSIIAIDINTNNTYYAVTGLNWNKQYYWKLVADNSIQELTSSVLSFKTTTIKNLANINVWLSASLGVETDGSGNVKFWKNQVNQTDSSFQATLSKQPKLTLSDSLINGQANIFFDGSSDYLINSTGYSFGAMYVVSRWSGNETTFPGYNGIVSTDGSGNATIYLFIGRQATSLIYSGGNPWGSDGIYVNKTKTLDFSPLNQYKILYGERSTPAAYARLLFGSAFTNELYWKGSIAEIIAFSSMPTDSIKNIINGYLQTKYAPGVTLGDDLSVYGFGPTGVSAHKPWYTGYSWSDGTSNDTLVVNQSGTYTVTVTDIFGNTSTDGIQVNYPTATQKSDTTFCLGDSVFWDTGLGNDYTYQWLGSPSLNSGIYISKAGLYAYEVTDTNGYKFYSDTIAIAIDSFPAKNNLGSDRSVCQGEAVTLAQQTGDITHWQWSTGSTQSYININTAGTYSVTVSNARGCQAKDTAIYSLSGLSPTVYFEADTSCYGDSTAFTNLSSIPGPDYIESISWAFGDGDTSTAQSPRHLYQEPDTFVVRLISVTHGGCSSFYQDSVVVRYRPQAGFATDYDGTYCTGSPVQFTDTSRSTVPITGYLWDFGDTGASAQQNPTHQYLSSGEYRAVQTATAQNGCSDTAGITLTIVDTYYPPQKAILESPTDGYFIARSQSVGFSWQAGENAIGHVFELSEDSSFITQLERSEKLDTTGYSYTIASEGIYYWRVTSYNLCGDSTVSVIRTIEYNAIDNLPGINLWLSASEGLVLGSGNRVRYWQNQVNALDSSYQSEDIKRPVLREVDSLVNSQPVVYFDGSNDFLYNSTGYTFGAMYVVSRWEGAENQFPGYNGMVSTYGSGNATIYLFIGNKNTSSIYSGATPWGAGGIYVNGQNTLEYLPLDRYKLVYGQTANPAAYAGLLIGSAFTTDHFWKGGIAEIIAFDTMPTDSIKNIINGYLQTKYAPGVTLGDDLSVYGFGPTGVSAHKPWYTGYSWSDGTSNDTLVVNQSGTYAVTVTDIFGFTSTDSIKVKYPEPTNIKDTLICRYDTVLWNPWLNGDYTYEWKSSRDALSADLTESELAITDPGKYWLIIRDTLGNPWYSDTVTVSVDEFPALVSLGNDTTLCKGSRVYLQNGYQEGMEYLWSNGETTEFMTLETAGTYSVTATNKLGCVGVDTAAFDVHGVAPNPDFSSANYCFNDSVQFTDISASPDGSALTSWIWDFGDGTVSFSQHSTHRFTQPNNYIVSLTVTNQDICSNTTRKTIPVYHLPEADFIPNATCSNVPVTFYDKTTSVDGAIIAWNWTFPNGSTSQQQNATVTLTETGYTSIELIVHSELGCSDTLLKQIDVKKGPLSDFSFSPACDGYPVYFSDKSESFLNMPLQYRWIFEPGMESNQSSPSFQFPAKGIYNVTLQTTQTANNCSSEVVKPVEVSDNPTADFSIPVFCVGNSATLVNESYSDQGVVDHWKWNVDEVGVFYSENLTLNIDEPGDYPVMLSIEDSNGCRDTLESVIPVNPLPIPFFETSVEKGPVPLLVSFSNLSSGANRYHWDFGDGSTSDLIEPQHTYSDSGVYQIRLIAESTVGCSDSVFNSVKGIVPSVDLAVLQIMAEQSNGFLKVGILVQNFGTLDISNINVNYITNYGGNFKEEIKQILASGSSYWHEFATQIEINPSVALTHVCASAYPYDLVDEVLGNNEACQAFEAGFKTLNPYPNPTKNDLVIEYIIPFEANVFISLFDDMGKKKKILYNDKATSGFNRHTIDISDLAYGMYIYKIEYQGITYSYQFMVK